MKCLTPRKMTLKFGKYEHVFVIQIWICFWIFDFDRRRGTGTVQSTIDVWKRRR